MLYSTGAHITKIVQIDESDDDEYFSTEEDSAGISSLSNIMSCVVSLSMFSISNMSNVIFFGKKNRTNKKKQKKHVFKKIKHILS